jgi:transcription-repair coupling factor (superfamily II helicase)
VLAKPYGVTKIDAGPKLMSLSFKPDAPVDATAIVALVQKNRHIKLAGNEKLRVERAIAEPAQRAQFVRELLRSLGQPTAALAAN